MATWTEIMDYLRQNYQLSRDVGSAFAIAGTAGGVRQVVSGCLLDREGQPWLEVCAEIGKPQRFSPADMLARNAELLIGSICEKGGRLYLRLVVDLPLVTAEVLDRALLQIGRQAMAIRELDAVEPVDDVLAIWSV